MKKMSLLSPDGTVCLEKPLIRCVLSLFYYVYESGALRWVDHQAPAVDKLIKGSALCKPQFIFLPVNGLHTTKTHYKWPYPSLLP